MTQLPLNLSSHNNHFLFSDHYLDEILRRTPRWQRETAPQAETFFTWLKELYQKEKAQLPQYKEAQLEENWIKPILRQLGHQFEGQGTIPALTQAKIRYPDYLFFATEADRHAAATSPNSTLHALAVGEVKRWGVPLNRKSKGGSSFDDNNPSYQIDYYLRATDLTWGLLSNGQQWRLVHKESSYKLDVYFEIDLEKALENENSRAALGAIHFFFAFFRQAAFVPDNDGRHFLNDALQNSRTYALQLENDLRENAYKALEQLILGFFAPSRNPLDPDNPEHRQQVYDNSLYLLYRILFLFYGESRGLLPLHNPEYKNFSLNTMALTATNLVDTGKNLPPMTTIHWQNLQTLFQIINGDDVALNQHLGVPRYNGGLFNPDLHPFLNQYQVGDRHLILAIDYLGRRAVVREGRYAGRENVDYRTLGVRQLGSIYEGLLEYQPRQATEPMVAVRQKGAEKWLPASQVKGRTEILERREPGELYLATDKGERKATGSYYTPDYIVKYIVEQTVGPLVERVRQAAAGHTARFVAGILQLNVLDPAMGSGHFLVEATDFLARALATGADVPGADTLPQVQGLQKVNGEADDLVYWRRQVVERCIYGVDKNRLAVELAKLSLWLVTAAAEQPLSFLDHHLRHGDSLVGARLADLARAPGTARSRTSAKSSTSTDEGQLPLFDEGAFAQDAFRAVGGMLTIEGMLSESIEDIHSKEQIYADLRGHLSRWQQLADLWVSTYFGNTLSREEYADLARYLQAGQQSAGQPSVLSTQPSALMNTSQRQSFLNHAAVLSNDYFHWELEFPELFFDRNGQPLKERGGFDAVIGNPPYVSAWSMTDTDSRLRAAIRDLLTGNDELMAGHWDVYIPFLIQSYRLSNPQSSVGFIIPNPFCREKYATNVRKFLLQNTSIRKIVPFGEDNVFDEVSRQTLVFVFSKQANRPFSGSVEIVQPAELFGGLNPAPTIIPQNLFLELSEYQIRYDVSATHLILLEKIKHMSNRLGEFCYVNYGAQVSSKEKGGFRKQDVVSRRPKGNAKKFFDGKDINRYRITWAGKFLDYRPGQMYGPRSPDLFENPKITIRDVTGANEQLIVSFDNTGLYCDHLIICATYYEHLNDSSAQLNFEGYNKLLPPYPDLLYVTGILASKILTWYFRQVLATGTLQGSYSHTYPQQIRAFPIRKIKFTTFSEVRSQLTEYATTHYHQNDHPALLALVRDCLAAQPEQADVVHDILAYLAEQMISLNQQKQALVSRFWTDLEGVTDTPTFRKLHDKGKQEASLVQAIPTLAQFLNPNSKSGKTLDESLAWSEDGFKGFVKLLAGKISGLSDLLAVYRTYSPEYHRLTHQLTTTDTLIDQIVYQLYGLTAEEIALVEGTQIGSISED